MDYSFVEYLFGVLFFCGLFLAYIGVGGSQGLESGEGGFGTKFTATGVVLMVLAIILGNLFS